MALVKSGKSLSVSELCRKMSASHRKVKPRTIREWWRQGLLPPPNRRYTHKASTTYWCESQVFARAKAAFDLLRQPNGRYDLVVLQLWLSGYPVPPQRVRQAAVNYLSSLNFGQGNTVSPENPEQLEDRINDYAKKLFKQLFANVGEVIHDGDAAPRLQDAIAFFVKALFEPEGEQYEDVSELYATVATKWKYFPGAKPETNNIIERLLEEKRNIDQVILIVRKRINFQSQIQLLRDAPDIAFVDGQRTIIVATNLLRISFSRTRPRLGMEMAKIRNIIIHLLPCVIGTYVGFVQTDEYTKCKIILIDTCGKARHTYLKIG